jgi:hypothetical protein
MLRRLSVAPIALAAVLILFLGSSAAQAQEEHRGFSLDLFGSYFTAEADGDTANEESWGLRGSYRFTNVWALEAALSTVREDDVNAYFGDVSLKAYLVDTSRFEGYLLGGAGSLKVEDEEETTLHLGLGAEIFLGERAYLRPEVRGHWFKEDVDAVTFLDYSLGVGLRF